MKLLKQTTSGEIYIWDAQLAKRPDMEDYVKPEVQSEPVQVEQAEIESVSLEATTEVNQDLPVAEKSKPATKKKVK